MPIGAHARRLCFATLAILLASTHALAAGDSPRQERRRGTRIPSLCRTDIPWNFTTGYRLNLNQDFHDYGVIVEDAGDELCALAAQDRLVEKLRNTLAMPMHSDSLHMQVGPYQGWLEGAHVSLVFAAAMELYGQGVVTRELDEELERVRDSYAVTVDPRCGFGEDRWQAFNNCMDDHTVAASAYGWIAAYEHARGRPAERWIDSTLREIHTSFARDSICIHDPAGGGPTPCNATVEDLRSGKAETLTLNHGQQSIAYGFGLLTSVAAGMLGLHYAGVDVQLTPDERTIALGLFTETASKSDTAGTHFKNNCIRSMRLVGDIWVRETGAACGEEPVYAYKPRMYRLDWFFARFVGPVGSAVTDGGVSQSAYQFNLFDPELFSDWPTCFQNAARRVTYGWLANEWWFSPPPMPQPGAPLRDTR